MKIVFEQNGLNYEMQGDYRLPCVTFPKEQNGKIGAWDERHRRFLKANHRI